MSGEPTPDRSDQDINRELDAIQRHLRDINQLLSSHSKLILVLRLSDVYILEFLLIANSFWASWKLFSPPSNFGQIPKNFYLAAHLVSDESAWATFALLAALIKLAGIAMSIYTGKVTTLCRVLRTVGLSMSGMFWTIIGISFMYGDIDSLLSFGAIVLGIFAWLSVIRLERQNY